MKTITCIIPAYNEGDRIRHVLHTVSEVPAITQIIAVDDGSTDTTADVIRHFSNVEAVILEQNKGKSNAISEGIQRARGEYLLFVDADLVGLTARDLQDLIDPVLGGEAEVSISLRSNTPPPWKWIGLDYISGERVVPRELLASVVDKIARLRSYGLEVWMNKRIIAAGYRIKVVWWPGVQSPLKHTKYGVIHGVYKDLQMLWHIRKTVPWYKCGLQIVRMRNLRVHV